VPGEPAALSDLPVLAQDPVHGGDRGHIHALVEQCRIDLRRRSVDELRAVEQRQNLLPLGGAERVRRH